MIKVYVEENEIFGPAIANIIGLGDKFYDTVWSQIEANLAYHADGSIGLIWANLSLPSKIKNRIVLVIA